MAADQPGADRQADAGSLVGRASALRANISNTDSVSAGATPMPLSVTLKRTNPFSLSAATAISGRRSAGVNLTAFETRFWNTCLTCARSPCTGGNSPTATCASRPSISPGAREHFGHQHAGGDPLGMRRTAPARA